MCDRLSLESCLVAIYSVWPLVPGHSPQTSLPRQVLPGHLPLDITPHVGDKIPKPPYDKIHFWYVGVVQREMSKGELLGDFSRGEMSLSLDIYITTLH